MSALHKEAIQILYEGRQILTMHAGLLTYSDTAKECPIGNSKFRADVYGKLDDEESILLEVRVTHGCDQPKIDYLVKNKIRCIEIDLHNIDPAITTEDLRQILLENVLLHKYIYWPLRQPDQQVPLMEQDIVAPPPVLEKTPPVGKTKDGAGNIIAVIMTVLLFSWFVSIFRKWTGRRLVMRKPPKKWYR
ncbi:MAG TPA: hypothetical protein VK666_21780 [Chryseolinea sp.]|nr:hypothetical protein [Chryseolinea sp.]